MSDTSASEAEGWLRLALTPAGPAGQRKLLAAFGSPHAVLSASNQAIARAAGERVAAALRAGADPQLVAKSLAWLEEPGNRLLTLADAAYPAALLHTADPPIVLYVKGRIELLGQRALAIVGSRSASASGVRDARAFAEALSNAGLVIVSGLALGIDTAAHRGGLAGASSSIGVVGTGLDKVYPARNRQLAHELAQRGVLISEFALGTPPLPGNFPRRNRVISGLSLGCLVVEAAMRSGSLITARQSAEQGREVFAIPGSIHSPLSKGCHWLIQQGAKLVETAGDVLDELGLVSGTRPDRETDEATLPPTEEAVLSAMGFAPIDLDTICERSGLTAEIVSTRLLELELRGHVDRLAGGLVQRLR